jgi:hypothetical protein
MSEDTEDPVRSRTNNDDDAKGEPSSRPKVKKYKASRKRRGRVEENSDIRFVMQSVLAELVESREDGKVRKISRQQAYLNADLNNALKGDAKATLRLFKKAQKYGLLTPPQHQNGSFLTEPTGDTGKIIRMFDAEQKAIKAAEENGDVGMQKVTRLSLSRKR